MTKTAKVLVRMALSPKWPFWANFGIWPSVLAYGPLELPFCHKACLIVVQYMIISHKQNVFSKITTTGHAYYTHRHHYYETFGKEWS